MAVAAYGFYIQSAPLLLICLFCMGTQSTLFGPLKYAILPDYLNDKELIMGNSLIESGTFIAILLGQLLGTAVAGVPPYIVGGLVLLVAVGGTMTSLFMPSVPAKMPDTKIEWNIIKGTNLLIREATASGSDRLWIIAGVADSRPTLYRIKRHHLVFIASPSVSDYARDVCHRLFRWLLLRTALHLAANRQQRNLPRPRRRCQQYHQRRVYGIGCHFERGFADVVRQHYAAVFDCCRG